MLAARSPHGSARRDLWPRCVHPSRASRSVAPMVSARPAAFICCSPLFLFFLSAAVIYFACEFFVNGVEWVGHRFQLGATATGTVLAAFGTALPESAVTFMAVVFGETPEQKRYRRRRRDGRASRAGHAGLCRGRPGPVARPPGSAQAGQLYQRGPAPAGPRPGLVHGHLRFQGGAGSPGVCLEALAGPRVPGHLWPSTSSANSATTRKA